jgi:hypothetical protein
VGDRLFELVLWQDQDDLGPYTLRNLAETAPIRAVAPPTPGYCVVESCRGGDTVRPKSEYNLRPLAAMGPACRESSGLFAKRLLNLIAIASDGPDRGHPVRLGGEFHRHSEEEFDVIDDTLATSNLCCLRRMYVAILGHERLELFLDVAYLDGDFARLVAHRTEVLGIRWLMGRRVSVEKAGWLLCCFLLETSRILRHIGELHTVR